jgi:hypothetical protein
MTAEEMTNIAISTEMMECLMLNQAVVEWTVRTVELAVGGQQFSRNATKERSEPEDLSTKRKSSQMHPALFLPPINASDRDKLAKRKTPFSSTLLTFCLGITGPSDRLIGRNWSKSAVRMGFPIQMILQNAQWFTTLSVQPLHKLSHRSGRHLQRSVLQRFRGLSVSSSLSFFANA